MNLQTYSNQKTKMIKQYLSFKVDQLFLQFQIIRD